MLSGPVAVSPDGLTVCHITANKVCVTPDRRFAFRCRRDDRKYLTDIAFHPSGKYLAATSNDKTVKLYDTATWRLATTFTWNIGRMRSIAFSPDGMLAAVGSDSGKVVVWDVISEPCESSRATSRGR